MRKPNKKLTAEIRLFLEYCVREGNRLGDAMDPEREGPGEDDTCLLEKVLGVATKAQYALHLPHMDPDGPHSRPRGK